MKRGEVCVAGWCPDQKRMIRPLRPGGHHWPPAMTDVFRMGNLVRLQPAAITGTRPPPHAREDTIIVGDPVLLHSLNGDQLIRTLKASESPSVEGIFGRPLVDHRYIPEGADCGSLGGIRTGAKQIGFDEEERRGELKLRCWFFDGDDHRYKLAVASKDLQDHWRKEGLESLRDLRRGHFHAHVRIGLAGAMEGGNECYAMVNNVLFY